MTPTWSSPLPQKGALSAEDRQALRECTKYFAGKTAPDHVRSAWRNVLGSWQEDCHGRQSG